MVTGLMSVDFYGYDLVCVGICSSEDVVRESFEADVCLATNSFWLED
jgi:hypothetical protein